MFLAAVLGTGRVNADGLSLCVSGDFVRMRKQPNIASGIRRNLFRLYHLDPAVPIGRKEKIGTHFERWYKVTYYTYLAPARDGPFTGYVYGAFLQDCGQEVRRLRRLLLSKKPLHEKLLYRKLFVGIRMLKNGRSLAWKNRDTGCCTLTSLVTAGYRWERKSAGILFHVYYEQREFVDEDEGPVATGSEKWRIDCPVTGLKVEKKRALLITPSRDKRCQVSIPLEPLTIGEIPRE